jgi:hypothetical protein
MGCGQRRAEFLQEALALRDDLPAGIEEGAVPEAQLVT